MRLLRELPGGHENEQGGDPAASPREQGAAQEAGRRARGISRRVCRNTNEKNTNFTRCVTSFQL